MRGLRDWRVWLGLAITAVSLWWVLRDVPLDAVLRDMSRADLPLLLALSIPSHVLSIWARALRWRHLTDAVQPIGSGPLFRATAVGFMANNVFPLRVGEVVRALYVAREAQADRAAMFGTVILERVLDSLIFLALAAALAGSYGLGVGEQQAAAILAPLAVISVVPLAGILVMRMAPAWTVRTGARMVTPLFGERVGERVRMVLERIAGGLGSLRGGRHLLWIAFHSATLWLVFAMLPFLAGLWALDIELGGTLEQLGAAYVTLVFVGILIAVPSAPGFFGPYHFACVTALGLFGVPKPQAVALGTVVHATFWVTITALGLVVLRVRRQSLEDLPASAAATPGKDPAPQDR